MAEADEHAALIVLRRAGQLPWRCYAELLEEEGSAVSILARELGPSSQSQPRLFEDDDSELHALLALASNEIAAWQRLGIELVSVLDSGYPENLRAAHDRPPLLFVAGQLTPSDARCIAVIGSRAASAAGMDQAAAVATHLAQHEYTVVSGLADGIDTAAHMAALRARGRTIAVIGTGLMRYYPPRNEALQRRIANECAVVSQFLPEAPPTRRSFPMRNAVMSGMALASVLIEASEKSGARIQARLALSQGRPVFLLASLLRQDWARSLAAAPGTYVVHDMDEITIVTERITSAGPLVG